MLLPTKDQWKCENCVFFDERSGLRFRSLCRRYPPASSDQDFPAVYNNDYCGEFQFDRQPDRQSSPEKT